MKAAIQRILIACDLSEDTRNLLSYGALLAEKNQARMVLVHVIAQREKSVFKRMAGIDKIFRKQSGHGAPTVRLRKRRYLELERLVKEMRIAPLVERRVVSAGLVYQEILRLANQSHADVIITGVGQDNHRIKKNLGATVRQIVLQSPVPVMTIPGRLKSENLAARLSTVNRPAA